MLIESSCCIYQAVLALLVAITIAAPVDNSAVEEKDSDDLQTAQQFGFGYGGHHGGFGGFGGYGGYSGYGGYGE